MTSDPVAEYRAELAGRLVTLDRERCVFVNHKQNLLIWWMAWELLLVVIYLLLLALLSSMDAFPISIGVAVAFVLAQLVTKELVNRRKQLLERAIHATTEAITELHGALALLDAGTAGV